MFQYINLAKILPVALNPNTTRLAERRRPLPVITDIITSAGMDIGKIEGFINFHDEQNDPIKIYLIYGTEFTECAMLHDIYNGKHIFILFIDYIIKRESDIAIVSAMKNIISVIIQYVYGQQVPSSKYVIDLYLTHIQQRIDAIAEYNVWKGLNKMSSLDPEKNALMLELDSLLSNVQ